MGEHGMRGWGLRAEGAIMTEREAMAIVTQVGEMNFEGNIIPQSWFEHLKYPSGKPHLSAIVILSEIVYWYRPREIRDEATGRFIGLQKKFKGDALQRSYESFAEQFGVGKREATDALKFLAREGLVALELRTVFIQQTGTKAPNVLFIHLLPARLKEITYSRQHGGRVPPKRNTPSGGSEEGSRGGGGPVPGSRKTNTESSLESTGESDTTLARTYEGAREGAGDAPAREAAGGGDAEKFEDPYPLVRQFEVTWWRPVVQPCTPLRSLLPLTGSPDPRDLEMLESILRNFAVAPGGLPGLLATLTARFGAGGDPRFRHDCLHSLRPLRLLWARLEEMYRLLVREEDGRVEHSGVDSSGVGPGTSAGGHARPHAGGLGAGRSTAPRRSDGGIYPQPPAPPIAEDDAGLVSYDW